MSTNLINSKRELEQANVLLKKKPPLYRKAYSDRTSWLMACLAELAYKKFNPAALDDSSATKIEAIAKELVNKDSPRMQKLLTLISSLNYDSEQQLEELVNELKFLKAELLTTFDAKGSQAILVKTSKFIVLAFRGTEPNSWRDIKADAKANLKECETGGRIHTGFDEAYKSLEIPILAELEKHTDKPLFITGHSLGGALATVAAKKITHSGGNAACYTFGSPRVADDKWLTTMKTPIYRVVNAADAVTMVPPAAAIIFGIAFILGFIPWVGPNIKDSLNKHFGRYLHSGDMRYLTNVKKGEYHKTNLLPHVDIAYRFKGWVGQKLGWKSILADHSISTYRQKLAQVAERRNS